MERKINHFVAQRTSAIVAAVSARLTGAATRTPTIMPTAPAGVTMNIRTIGDGNRNVTPIWIPSNRTTRAMFSIARRLVSGDKWQKSFYI